MPGGRPMYCVCIRARRAASARVERGGGPRERSQSFDARWEPSWTDRWRLAWPPPTPSCPGGISRAAIGACGSGLAPWLPMVGRRGHELGIFRPKHATQTVAAPQWHPSGPGGSAVAFGSPSLVAFGWLAWLVETWRCMEHETRNWDDFFFFFLLLVSKRQRGRPFSTPCPCQACGCPLC